MLRPYEEKPKSHTQKRRVRQLGVRILVMTLWIEERCYGRFWPLRAQHGIWRFADGARFAPREFAIDAR